jgi:hypothetical protein
VTHHIRSFYLIQTILLGNEFKSDAVIPQALEHLPKLSLGPHP